MCIEYLCTNNEGVYEMGKTIEEAYFNLELNQGPLEIDECDFYECTKIEVQQKTIYFKS